MRLRRIGVPVVAALGAVAALPAAPAAAESAPAVERTAWFNAASGGGLALPQPTTTEDDLRVARAIDTQAFSTLLYRGEGVRASLAMAVREDSAQGTPDVVACPTVAADWAEGGNQPMDAAPEVDCSLSISYGQLSDDGLLLSFGLDAGFEVAPGTWSIALVPAPGGVTPGPPPTAPMPFTLDLQPPAPGAFVLEDAFELPSLPTDMSSSAGTGTDTGTAPPASGFAVAGDLGGLPSEVGSGGSAAAPLDPAVAAPVPEAADQAVPAPLAARPLLVRRAAASGGDDSGRRLLALIALAGGSAAVGYAAGQQRPAPRLIGGRARYGNPTAAATVVADPRQDRPRGIGRFAQPREAAPRRLR